MGGEVSAPPALGHLLISSSLMVQLFQVRFLGVVDLLEPDARLEDAKEVPDEITKVNASTYKPRVS